MKHFKVIQPYPGMRQFGHEVGKTTICEDAVADEYMNYPAVLKPLPPFRVMKKKQLPVKGKKEKFYAVTIKGHLDSLPIIMSMQADVISHLELYVFDDVRIGSPMTVKIDVVEMTRKQYESLPDLD